MDSSLAEYEAQLAQVEQALLVTAAPEDRVALETLKTDLLELLELTKQQGQHTAAGAERSSQPTGDALDTEMQNFMQELQALEATSTSNQEEEEDGISVEHKLQELKEQLEEMVGQKCAAPHEHSWGAVAYHNAIVCGLEDTVNVGDDGVLDVRLRVLFTNPTHKEMLPCTFYLEGECRFDEERCHYSHGELVPASALRQYSAPDFERLRRNCVVLAKLQDRIWYRGRVLCANFVEKTCRVRLDEKQQKERERDFNFEDLLPIYNDDDLSSDGSSSDGSDESSSEALDEFEIARRARMVEQSLFSFQPTQPLGEWEKHTRGIGSKLMAKMGYIHGAGLGSDGRGIVIPVSAQILPQGRSLDHCMELREAANGDKDLFSVEKKLKQQQKKQDKLNAQAYERASKSVDVFSFLNDNILSNEVKSEATPGKVPPKKCLKSETTKSLNVASVRIADDIRRKEREICKLNESVRRNANSSDVQKRIQLQITARNQELQALQKEERSLTREQASRKSKDKLTVF